jgi:thiazole synthase
MTEDLLHIGSHTFKSRLFVGTGKYASVEQTRLAIETSGAEVVTVALRRVDLKDRSSGSMMELVTSGLAQHSRLFHG